MRLNNCAPGGGFFVYLGFRPGDLPGSFLGTGVTGVQHHAQHKQQILKEKMKNPCIFPKSVTAESRALSGTRPRRQVGPYFSFSSSLPWSIFLWLS